MERARVYSPHGAPQGAAAHGAAAWPAIAGQGAAAWPATLPETSEGPATAPVTTAPPSTAPDRRAGPATGPARAAGPTTGPLRAAGPSNGPAKAAPGAKSADGAAVATERTATRKTATRVHMSPNGSWKELAQLLSWRNKSASVLAAVDVLASGWSDGAFIGSIVCAPSA